MLLPGLYLHVDRCDILDLENNAVENHPPLIPPIFAWRKWGEGSP